MGVPESITEFGKVAGVAGVALGVLLVVFRDVLRRTLFSTLTAQNSYRLLRLIIVLTWSVAIVGMVVWWLADSGRIKTASWTKSNVLMQNLKTGLSRSFVVQDAGEPSRTLMLEAEGRVDFYGDNCCGEFWLFYDGKGALSSFAVKVFEHPFDFRLAYGVDVRLGKSRFVDLGAPLKAEDGFTWGKAICNVESHYFGKPGGYNHFYVATLLAKDWFDGEGLKSHREWPIESLYVSREECADDGCDGKARACTWFDDYETALS
ncbi:hypothetical protein JVX96_24355 [Variovorax sp. PDNC026]|uniref:ETEC_3214 domain-containing protein n=1 Tax=Variovorax sp. PDNC026 TaxID=2811425 RepID=UPI0019640547|nr:ETEC_3214 domain-containing protein [Variovorax sp. PDNC026]QRY31180.1 hypothetical protein JVX96_24355 [Variovorax sp. PDNC026]